MTEERKKKLKGTVIVGGIFSLIMSLFISCAVHEKMTINPLRWLISIFKYGFPFRYFLIFAILFAALIIYMQVRMSGALEEDDRNFLYAKSGTYGTAKLLKTKEDLKGVAKIQSPAYARGTIFGQMDLSGKKLINLDMDSKENHRNKHVAVFGASSSGKTYSYVKPFCIQVVRRRESLIITDPKGELYEDTAQYFADSGYIVRRFNLKDLSRSDGWDILGEIQGNPDRADILAKIIWSNISDGSSGGVFESGPVSLLKAILLRVALDDSFKEQGIQNIGEAYKMLQNPEGEDYLNGQFDPAKLDEKTKTCIGPYMSYKQASPNMRGNILITLSSLLNVFQSELVRKITSTNDIDLTLPGKVPCVYYCILPDMHSTYNFIGAVFFSFLFLDLVDYADSTDERRCKVPVNFLLDEFANIGSIPEFDKKLATIRSRALNVSIILQDLPQLMGRYPETYKSILSNCATYVCIGCNDADTATFFSDRAGETTIQVRTDQHEKVEPAFRMGNKHSTGDGKRKIFTNDELMTFGMDECLIVWQALYTMRAYKYPFAAHPEKSRMKKVKIADYPSITEDPDWEAKRKALREEEAKRAKEYQEKWDAGWNPFEYFGGVRESVPDEEIEAEQKVFWYEKAWLILLELKHTATVMIDKAKKWYKDNETEVREKIINPHYVDASVVAEDSDELFDIVTTDVEEWGIAQNDVSSALGEDEAWVTDAIIIPDQRENKTASERTDIPDDISDTLSYSENTPTNIKVEEKGKVDLSEPSADEDEEEPETIFYTSSDDYDPDEDDFDDDEDGFDEDDEDDTDDENGGNKVTEAVSIEENKLSEELSANESPVQSVQKEEFNVSKSDPSSQKEIRSKSKSKENKNDEVELNWDILGDKAEYTLQSVAIDTFSGSSKIDQEIAHALQRLECSQKPKNREQKETKRSPNMSDMDMDLLSLLAQEQESHIKQPGPQNGQKNGQRKGKNVK